MIDKARKDAAFQARITAAMKRYKKLLERLART